MEEVQRKGAVHTLLDWFRPQQGAGDAIHPAGVQTTDNTDETAREDGVSVLRKFVGKKVGVTKPFLAVTSLLLLSGVLLRVSSKRKFPVLSPHREWATPSLNNVTGCSLYDLEDAQLKMNAAWELSDPSVRHAFQKYFMPSLDDGQALIEDPLAIINEHVTKMKECKFPFDSSAKIQSDFLQHVELLVSICRMVTIRLKELDRSLSLEGDFLTAGTFAGREEPDSNPGHRHTSRTYPMVADEFLDTLGMHSSMPTLPIDGSVGAKIVSQFLIQKNSHLCNLEARYYFERFLEPFEGGEAVKFIPSSAKHEIPYSGKAFRTGALAEAAAKVFRQSEGSTNYARICKMHRIADNWTPQGVLEAAKQQEKEISYNYKQRLFIKKEQMRVLRKKGIQNSDFEMIPLFLL